MAILMFIIIGIVLLMILYIISGITANTIINFALKHFNTNIEVYGQKNLKEFNNLNIVIMSNHHSALDQAIITQVINDNIISDKKIYTVVKHNMLGDKNDQNFVSNLLGPHRKFIYKFFNFIPYIRGNLKSGLKIKSKMTEIIKRHKNTILLFPEGETTREAIPKAFKPGSFKLCSENNIGVLPVSLKFNKRVGGNKGDKVKISRWYNANVKVYIHEPIFDSNWENLRTKVFHKIREPLI
jgi:1-acyl-sn-glycerol-3-phosphate acyltransferase